LVIRLFLRKRWPAERTEETRGIVSNGFDSVK
jgi:hypothetical protein